MQEMNQETLVQQTYLNEQHGWHPQFRDAKHKRKNAIYGLGIAEVVMGGISILLSIVIVSIARNEAYKHPGPYSYGAPAYGYNYIAQGIWGGVFIVTTGSLGILVKRTPTKGLYIANMVMAIITANAAGVVVIISAFSAAVTFSPALSALHVMISVLFFALFILTIIHAAFCCGGVCCLSGSEDTHQLIHDQQHTGFTSQHPQYVRGPDGKLLMITQQQPMVNGAPVGHHAYSLKSGPSV